MTLAYVAGLSFFGYRINRSLAQAWRLRFENMDLVQELSVQKRAAERADAAKSHFLAAASHDLRQPLHALTLFVGALDERIRYPEVRRIVDNIKSSTRALEDLFNALLDMSRLDAGVLRADVRDFELDPILERVRHDFGPSAREKGIALHCPPCSVALRSDPVLLEQILRNYVSNAVRHTERGAVRVHCLPAGGGVRITVADTGPGIPQGQHEAIFREFYQLGNPERDRGRGLGLGLAIVARLAKLLEHPIHLESAPGEGARFSVDVPRGRAQAPGPEAGESPEGASDLHGLEVLVLDDDPAARESLRELLETWGCRVRAAATQREAHEGLRAGGRAPDAIIADYRLRGGETGDAAIRSLRAAIASPVPSLIVTGDTALEPPRDDTGIGFHLLHKPVQPARLRAFLRHARRAAAAQA
jgi:CheY-like chemotaxis protein/nitrogen-specific signal transduction histidine kinase